MADLSWDDFRYVKAISDACSLGGAAEKRVRVGEAEPQARNAVALGDVHVGSDEFDKRASG